MSRVLNVSELGPPGAKFVDFPDGFDRIDFSGLPNSWLEQVITRPRLSRYRAAFAAASRSAGAYVISHLPRMTAAVADGLAVYRSRPPHLAFSFNFTELPTGIDLWRFRRSLRAVDRFCVFSSFESEAYSDLFHIDPARFRRLLWAQDPPAVSAESIPGLPPMYVSAVGGEGRDYKTLMRAASLLRDVPFVIVARPYNDFGSVPSNVRLLHNLSADLTWRIARDSLCLVVPLKDRTTACGHITLVSGHLLGIPMISSHSEATREYTDQVSMYEPGDVPGLAELIRRHVDAADTLRQRARSRISEQIRNFSRAAWQAEISDFLLTH